MYNLMPSQNGHFNIEKPTKRTIYLSCPMTLIKANILLVNVDTLIKLDILKSYDFLYEYKLLVGARDLRPL
jgi:hypothetical protein